MTDIPIPPPSEYLVKPKTGLVTQNWYQYFAQGNQSASSSSGGIDPFIRASDYGAVADGVHDDRAAIQAAISAATALGGGTVLLGPGTHRITNAGSATGIALAHNVCLMGMGRNVTIVKQGDGEGCHVIQGSGVNYASVCHMTVDGNVANNAGAGTHCIRGGGTGMNYFSAWDLEIKNAPHYGMGFQAGLFTNFKITDIYFHDINADAIDFKNDTGNYNLTLENISIRHWGTDTVDNVAIDIRASNSILMSDIYISNPDSDSAVGVLFRTNDCPQSGIQGFFIDLQGTTTSAGIIIQDDNCYVANGAIQRAGTGLQVDSSAPDCKISNVDIQGCAGDGFSVSALRTLISNCNSGSNGGDGYDVSANQCSLSNCFGRSNTGWGFNVSGANAKLIGGGATSNTAGQATVTASSRIVAVQGLVDQ